MKSSIGSLVGIVSAAEEAAESPEVALVSEEESLDLSLGPVLHGVGQHLHGHLVPTQIVAHKYHPLHPLCTEKKSVKFFKRLWYPQTLFTLLTAFLPLLYFLL